MTLCQSWDGTTLRVWLGGDPLPYFPTAGDIGKPVKRIELEPLPETYPIETPTPAPAPPPQPAREPVPA